MLTRESAEPVKREIERIAAHGNGDCHLKKEEHDAVFVPGLMRDVFDR
jgi:hypothetical protein